MILPVANEFQNFIQMAALSARNHSPVRWYLSYPLSYRQVAEIVNDRGVEVDHTTIYRWVQEYSPEIDKRIRPHLYLTNDSWRVDETYILVKGKQKYLYRAVDSQGNSLDFRLCCKNYLKKKLSYQSALVKPPLGKVETGILCEPKHLLF